MSKSVRFVYLSKWNNRKFVTVREEFWTKPLLCQSSPEIGVIHRGTSTGESVMSLSSTGKCRIVGFIGNNVGLRKNINSTTNIPNVTHDYFAIICTEYLILPCFLAILNPFIPNHLISPLNISKESNIKVMRIWERLINWRTSKLLNKFS